MERVTFLVERTGERLAALLNPHSIEVRRSAGVRPLRSASGPLTGAALTDDPLLFTGGGTTELTLDLLFDVTLPGTSLPAGDDVRVLTAPFWRMTENSAGFAGGVPVVRFVWGKSWNVPGVVTAVAERLEQFTQGGAPTRSWMRLRLVRVSEPPPDPETGAAGGSPHLAADAAFAEDQLGVHESTGGGAPGAGERLDEIAQRHYGDASYWRMIASFNNVDDPMRLAPGTLLRLPPASAVRRGS